MSGVITREIAEQFLTDVDSVLPFRKDAADLKNFTSLTDDAAEPLSSIKDNLDLSGLTEISVEAAISLAKHQGTRLDLSGLTEISDAVAESLSKYQGNLALNGLTSLTDSAAASLSKVQPLNIEGISLTSLSDAAAKSLDRSDVYTAKDALAQKKIIDEWNKQQKAAMDMLKTLPSYKEKSSSANTNGGCLSLIVIGLTASFLLGRAITALVN